MLKNITLTAEEALIAAARERAAADNTTLNERFRQWLESYAAPPVAGNPFRYTREEINERSPEYKVVAVASLVVPKREELYDR